MKRQIFWKTRRIGGLLCLLLLAGVCGCGNTATVTGKVTSQGRPVRYGSVILLSADKTARSGAIEPDSSYTVEGVPPGIVKIGVISRSPARRRSAARDRTHVAAGKNGAGTHNPAIEGWFPLPPKFESPETSGLGCTVASGRFSYDIDLK